MDAYGLTLRKHVHLNDRKKWLANYIRVGGGGGQADPDHYSTPLLSSRHHYTVLFLCI